MAKNNSSLQSPYNEEFNDISVFPTYVDIISPSTPLTTYTTELKPLCYVSSSFDSICLIALKIYDDVSLCIKAFRFCNKYFLNHIHCLHKDTR